MALKQIIETSREKLHRIEVEIAWQTEALQGSFCDDEALMFGNRIDALLKRKAHHEQVIAALEASVSGLAA